MVLLYVAVVFGFNRVLREANRQEMEDNAILTSYLVKFVKLLKDVFIR